MSRHRGPRPALDADDRRILMLAGLTVVAMAAAILAWWWPW